MICEMDLENWMGSLKNVIWNKKLSSIVIPGTHDSGTYCINSNSKRTKLLPDLQCLNPLVGLVGAPWARTQQFSIADQLLYGVRYLDLRVLLDSDDGNMYLVHSFEGGEFWKELEGVSEFVQNHPAEVLILDMNHIYYCNESDMQGMLTKVETMFGSKLCSPPLPGSSVKTYGEMIDSNQTVIVAITEYPEQDNSKYVYKDLKNRFSWLWGSEANVVSPWGNSDDVNQLQENLKKSMAEPRTPDSVHVTQTILTPQTKDVVIGLFEDPSNLEQLAEILNPHLPDWFQEFKKDYNLNIAIVDFLTPTLINQLVNLNLAE